MLRFAWPIVLGLTFAMRCFAQEALPQVSFLPVRVCDPVATGDQGTGAQSSTAEIENLLADLPPGTERDIALELLNEVSIRSLPGFCQDPRNGDFVATSVSGIGSRASEYRVALGDRSLPKIEVDVSFQHETGAFDYGYRLSNGAAAAAPITTWGLMVPASDRTKSMTHPIWPVAAAAESDPAVAVAVQESAERAMGPTISVGGRDLSRWKMPSDEFAIQAGASLALFAVNSAFRPGWTTAYVGSDDAIELPRQPLREDVKAGLEVLSKPEHYYTSVLTIGPKFGPSTDRPWIAGDWLTGVQTMVAAGSLSARSPYVAEVLDSLARIGASAPEARVPLEVGTPPEGAMEALIDKVLRMALR